MSAAEALLAILALALIAVSVTALAAYGTTLGSCCLAAVPPLMCAVFILASRIDARDRRHRASGSSS